MEENYRWIKCTYVGLDKECEVVVRQSEISRDVFLDENGNKYGIANLDFTQISEQPSFISDFNERMRKQDEEHERTQNQLREMLASMDAKVIADHQSVIDEAAYWRKLRGDIFMKILERGGEFTKGSELEWAVKQTDANFRALYKQHQDFLTEKQK